MKGQRKKRGSPSARYVDCATDQGGGKRRTVHNLYARISRPRLLYSIFIKPLANVRDIDTTLAARFGVAADNWLFYGKAGGGWVGVNNPTITNVTTGGSISVSNSNSNSGWLAGGGIEWGFAPNWTARLEYDFLGLSSQTYTVAAPNFPAINGAGVTVSNRDVQTLTVGINYLFKWW